MRVYAFYTLQNYYFNVALKWILYMQEILVLTGKRTYFYNKGDTKAEKVVNCVKGREGNRGIRN